jgi:hypothetical protein
MRHGSCRLCGRDSLLEDSHLVPAAVYRLLHSPVSPNPNPVFITSRGAVQTSRQTKTYLLCRRCEDIFSAEGEKHITPLLAKEDKSFPLFDLLIRVPPDLITEKATAYAAIRNPNIPVEALTHFALGIFWKASVHHWQGSKTENQIQLGPYEEKIRLFIREPRRVPFPENVALMISVLHPQNVTLLMNLPEKGPRGDGFRNFRFYVPGILFVLSVGKLVDREFCFQSNPLHPIFVSDFADQVNNISRRLYFGGKMQRASDQRFFRNSILLADRRKKKK